MTTEISSDLTPQEVLEATREFFMGPDAVHSAWLEGESAAHLSFGTFRGNLAVAAFPDPEAGGATRVRITTLRDEGAVPRLVTHLRILEAARAAPASNAEVT